MPEASPTAMTQILGNYNLRINLSNLDRNLIVDPQSIQELSITQDIHSFLPSLRMIIPSAGEQYIHTVPLDATDKISIDIGYDTDIYAGGNGFEFKTYRRFPKSHNAMLDIEALLDIGNLLDMRYIRGFSDFVSTTLENIANEFILSSPTKTKGQRRVETRISPTLRYSKNIVQANQTNAELLIYLQEHLKGKDDECGYYCFFYNRAGRTCFVFQTIEEFFRGSVKHHLCYGGPSMPEEENTQTVKFYYPVWSYEIVDNYKLEGIEGLKGRNYRYFDYENGKLVEDSIELSEMHAITRKFSVLNSDLRGLNKVPLGRSNDFSETFRGTAKGHYYKSLMNLERIRVNTYGILNAVPGDLIQLYFSSPFDPEGQMDFQYQGVWMLETIRHTAAMTLTSTLTLVRSGVDITINNQLIDVTKRKI